MELAQNLAREIGPKRVLLIEDDLSVADAFKEGLERMGCIAVKAHTCSEARAEARNQRFDIVIVDLVLPDCNGLELACELRQAYPELNIVICSGYFGDAQLMRNVLKCQFAIYPKPLKFDLLGEIVRMPSKVVTRI